MDAFRAVLLVLAVAVLLVLAVDVRVDRAEWIAQSGSNRPRGVDRADRVLLAIAVRVLPLQCFFECRSRRSGGSSCSCRSSGWSSPRSSGSSSSCRLPAVRVIPAVQVIAHLKDSTPLER